MKETSYIKKSNCPICSADTIYMSGYNSLINKDHLLEYCVGGCGWRQTNLSFKEEKEYREKLKDE